MAKKRKKTDFTEQDARIQQWRAYQARKDEELRQERARAAAEPKRG